MMEYIATLLVSSLAAYYIGKKIGEASRSLEEARIVIVETNNLNRQIIDRLEIMTTKLRGMAIK